MAVDINTKEDVRIVFTVTEGLDTFTDALYLSHDAYEAITEEELTVLKMERYNNWKNHIAVESAKG